MEPRFYLSSKVNKDGRSTVMLFLYSHEKRITISTGKVIKPVNWNDKAQRARGNDKAALEFNNYLHTFGAKAVSTLSELIEKKEPHIVERFRKEIKSGSILDAQSIKDDLHGINGSFLDFIGTLIKTINRPKRTLAQYSVTSKNLIAFQQKIFRQPLHFENIDLNFYNQYVAFCQEHKNYSINTIGKEIKNIKFFMGEAEERELHNNLKFKSKKFKKPGEESFSIYLDTEQIEQLYNFDFSNEPEKDKVRDLFVASCWLGLRISDLLSVTKAHIRKNIISIKTEKINEYVDIPLHHTVKEILEKYDGVLPNNMSEQHFNRVIKEVAREAGFVLPVAYSISKGGRKEKIFKPIYELISAHTARRSFATNMYKLGLNIQIIMALTGHKTEKVFMSYVKSKRINAIKELEAIFN